MQNSSELTKGSIKEYVQGNTDFTATVQVLNFKEVGKNKKNTVKKKRYRIWISDGDNCTNAIVGKTMGDLIRKGELTKNSIIKISDCVIHEINNKRFIVLLSFDIMKKYDKVIGKPEKLQLSTFQIPKNPSQQQHERKPSEKRIEERDVQNQEKIPAKKVKTPKRIKPSNELEEIQPRSNTTHFGSNVRKPPVQQQQRQGQGQGTKSSLFSPSPKKGRKRGYGDPKFHKHRLPAIIANQVEISESEVRPISHLNFYDPWVIKVRVISKSDIKEWSKSERSGKVASIIVVDDEKSEIKICMFNSQVDVFYDKFEIGKVYLVGRGTLKYGDKRYSKGDFEITMETKSVVKEVGDDPSIAKCSYKFVPFDKLSNVKDFSIVDVFGMVQMISPIIDIRKKDGTQTTKRDIELVNKASNSDRVIMIKITLWDQKASDENINYKQNDILALKNVKKRTYNGPTLSYGYSTKVEVNPDVDEVRSLRDFMSNQNLNVPIRNNKPFNKGTGIQSPYQKRRNLQNQTHISIESIDKRGIGRNKKEWVTVLAHVSYIDMSKDPWYDACPNVASNGKKCMKKLTQLTSQGNFWKCQKCNAQYNQSEKRYILSLQIMDDTGCKWTTLFHEIAMKLLKINPDELSKIKENNEEEYHSIMKGVMSDMMIFNIKAELNDYRDNATVKLTVVDIQESDPKRINQTFLRKIENYDA